MVIRFWGVRGTMPVPGASTVRYGGNTACVSVEMDAGVLILDAGTGLRNLGRALVGSSKPIYLLVTHLHFDHIAGFPFFDPLFEKGRPIYLFDYVQNGTTWSLFDLLDSMHCPITDDKVTSSTRRLEMHLASLASDLGQIRLEKMNHPGGAYGVRIDQDGKSFVYMPDNELNQNIGGRYEEFVEFARGATVLCHDAQYDCHDLVGRTGWGHSCFENVCSLAIDAAVDHLLLFHHDPARTDDDLDHIQRRAASLLDGHGIHCTVAYEGLRLDLGSPVSANTEG